VRTADSSLELSWRTGLCEAGILKNPMPRGSGGPGHFRNACRATGRSARIPRAIAESAEALLRRILSGKTFPGINCVVDIINLVSVESRLPIGLYDLAKVQGDVRFRAGAPVKLTRHRKF